MTTNNATFWKYYIIYDGVTGTDSDACAAYWRKCNDAVVIEAATGMQLMEDGTARLISEEQESSARDAEIIEKNPDMGSIRK